jgi:hypothetical protein
MGENQKRTKEKNRNKKKKKRKEKKRQEVKKKNETKKFNSRAKKKSGNMRTEEKQGSEKAKWQFDQSAMIKRCTKCRFCTRRLQPSRFPLGSQNGRISSVENTAGSLQGMCLGHLFFLLAYDIQEAVTCYPFCLHENVTRCQPACDKRPPNSDPPRSHVTRAFSSVGAFFLRYTHL